MTASVVQFRPRTDACRQAAAQLDMIVARGAFLRALEAWAETRPGGDALGQEVRVAVQAINFVAILACREGM